MISGKVFQLILQHSDKANYIVNFTSSQDIQVRWEEIVVMGRKVLNDTYPINDILWYPGGDMTKSRLVHNIRAVLFHWLPALFIDTLLFCLGFKPM